MANDDKLGALNIRDFPKELIRKAKIKATSSQQNLREFVESLLREATKDVPDTKPPKGR